MKINRNSYYPTLSSLRGLALCLLAGIHLSAAAVDAPVTARIQRFFPVKTLNVTKIDAAKDLLYVKNHGIPKNGVDFALIWNRGTLSSSPSITRLYAGKGLIGLADSSTGADKLYALRAIDSDHLKLFPSEQEARANVSALNLLGQSSGYTEVTDVGITTATSNWCWNACSQMIMDKGGKFFEQDAIADYAFLTAGVGRYLNWGNHLSAENVALAGLTVRRGVARIVKDLAGMDSQVQDQLDNDRLIQEITAARPMIFQIGWYPYASKPNERDGGHVFVAWGFDGTNLKIHDPWPSLGTQTLNIATLRTNGYQANGRWEHTLATGKSLDLVFLIDTTGSMADDIANAKANATAIINKISTEFKDYRIAVVEYRDYPQTPWGSTSDFITRVRTSFTNNPSTALNAINAMTTGGGADWPEAVFSAAYATLEGTIVGGWRSNPTNRMIIMMGDAPGHNPEPWANGKSLAQVLAKANASDFPIRISGITIGGDKTAQATFDTLASLTGGSSYNTATAAGVSTAITAAINDLAESTRFPRLETGVLKPKFTFPEKLSPATDDPPTGQVLELQRLDLKKSLWRNYATVTLPAKASSWIPTKALPVGLYRWRMNYKFASGIIRNPSGGILEKTTAKVITDNTWTGFQRLPAIPEKPTPVLPSRSFRASSKSVTYTFNTAIHATSYALEIWTGGKLWKRLTVVPPAKAPNVTSLTTTIRTHTVGKSYTWRVQSLNIDRPKPVADGWAQ
jgi:Mg-chelatase subunit ChlD